MLRVFFFFKWKKNKIKKIIINVSKCSNISILFLLNHVETQLKFLEYSSSDSSPWYCAKLLLIPLVWLSKSNAGFVSNQETSKQLGNNGNKKHPV